MSTRRALWVIGVSLLFGLQSWSCAPTISTFSPIAYEQATSLKVDALALMDKAVEPYADREAEVATLNLRLAKAYEFSRGRPTNEISTRQWQVLMDPTRNLLGGFLSRWKEKSTLSPTFIREAKGLAADAFDTIIGLESGKVKPEQVK